MRERNGEMRKCWIGIIGMLWIAEEHFRDFEKFRCLRDGQVSLLLKHSSCPVHRDG